MNDANPPADDTAHDAGQHNDQPATSNGPDGATPSNGQGGATPSNRPGGDGPEGPGGATPSGGPDGDGPEGPGGATPSGGPGGDGPGSPGGPEPRGESVDTGSRLVTFVEYATFGILCLLALVATFRFYFAASEAIRVWFSTDFVPVFQAAFNLVVLVAAALGISVLVRRIGAE